MVLEGFEGSSEADGAMGPGALFERTSKSPTTPRSPTTPLSPTTPRSPIPDEVIVCMQPGADWGRRKSGSSSKLPADEQLIFGAKFIEVFAIGGGFKWIYALIEFLVEFLEIFSDMGVPLAGQFVLIMRMLLIDSPPLGPLLQVALGAVARHSYKLAALDQHPALRDYWDPKPSCLQRTLCCVKSLDAPLPQDQVFPFVEHGLRGTPEHVPITSFENALVANERGDPLDLLFRGEARSFRATFKTGNRRKDGGKSIFTVVRKAVNSLCSLICYCIAGMCIKTCAPCCSCCCSNNEAEAAESTQIYGADGVTYVGQVRQSKQTTFWERLFRTRFNKSAKPVYDILDATGNIIYTIVVPIRRYRFLYCLCDAYADDDCLAIVPGPRQEGRYLGAEMENYGAVGWIVQLTPYWKRFVDRFLAGLGQMAFMCGLLKVAEKAITLCQTCPVDNCTQVPNPGRHNLRCSTPCSHTLAAYRVCLPAGATEDHYRLISAAVVQIDMENKFLAL